MEQLNYFFYKLTVEYDGTNYCGFQKQYLKSHKSIEGQILQAIKLFTSYDVKITVSGRTDAGVHAIEQVISFKLLKKINEHQMIMGLNFYLQDDAIAVIKSEIVDKNFNARLDAKMRSYRYIILNRKAVPTLDKHRLWHLGGKKLNIENMKIASQYLIGEHDFSSFRDAECQGKSPIKTISSIEITLTDDKKIFIDISAKSFLHHMVRNIVGTLVWAGQEKISPEFIKNILLAKDRKISGPNAPACGLYFLKTIY